MSRTQNCFISRLYQYISPDASLSSIPIQHITLVQSPYKENQESKTCCSLFYKARANYPRHLQHLNYTINSTSSRCVSPSSSPPSSLALPSLCPILSHKATPAPAQRTTAVLAARCVQAAQSVWGGQAPIPPRGRDAPAAGVKHLVLDFFALAGVCEYNEVEDEA